MSTGEHTPVVRVARQSIVDRHRVLQAYELLFRGTVDEARGFDGTEASATSLVTAMLDIGWDRLRGGKSLYLNVDEGFLLSRLVHVAPPDTTVVERLAVAGVAMQPLSALCVGSRRHSGLVIGYGAVATTDLEPAFARLRAILT